MKTVEDALHVGRLRSGGEDVPIKLFRRTRLIGKWLADNLGKNRGNFIISGSLIAKPIGLAMVFCRVQQAGRSNGGDILNVNPASPSLADVSRSR